MNQQARPRDLLEEVESGLRKLGVQGQIRTATFQDRQHGGKRPGTPWQGKRYHSTWPGAFLAELRRDPVRVLVEVPVRKLFTLADDRWGIALGRSDPCEYLFDAAIGQGGLSVRPTGHEKKSFTF